MASGLIEEIQHKLEQLPWLSTNPLEEKLRQPWSYPGNIERLSTPLIESSGCATPVEETVAEVSNAITQDEEPHVAVIGCGYVGTHLVGSFAAHYKVLGFDVSEKQIATVRAEHGDRARFSTNPEDLASATHFLVSVPTLLKADKTIDTAYIRSALSTISKHARKGATVVIESSVAVGMTRELVGPLATEKGFFVGMSPERVDPGRVEPPMHSIPKIISGLDDVVPGSLAAISRLYTPVFATVVPVTKPEVAEMMKLYENCQRMMCIAYANEMANACIPHGIDPYEVCKAAATKPFGYMPFTPSLGVGGHCIPVNPYYLLSNSDFPLLKAATESMWQRPSDIGQRALDELCTKENLQPANATGESGLYLTTEKAKDETRRKRDSAIDVVSEREPSVDTSTPTSKPRVLVVGVGFKTGQSVLSNSPGQKLVEYLARSGKVDAMFADSLVSQEAIPHVPRLDDSKWTKEGLESFDMIIAAFQQTGMDFTLLNQLDGVRVQRWYK